MDLKKFISILQDNALFFSSARNLEDKFEGSITQKNIEYLKSDMQHLSNDEMRVRLKNISKLHKDLKNIIHINCWHKSDFESIAMWKIYIQNDEGIAIKSTYNNLKDSIIDERRIFAGEVNYIDYTKDSLPRYNALPHFLTKRREFQYENEVRLITDEHKNSTKEVLDTIFGVKIKVEPIKLIEEIIISPYSPKWFKEVVEGIANKYDLKAPTKISQLNSEPIF